MLQRAETDSLTLVKTQLVWIPAQVLGVCIAGSSIWNGRPVDSQGGETFENVVEFWVADVAFSGELVVSFLREVDVDYTARNERCGETELPDLRAEFAGEGEEPGEFRWLI